MYYKIFEQYIIVQYTIERGVIVQYIIAILLQIKLLDNKEKDRLEMHYSFNQEDIMKEIERFFTNENKQSNDQSNSTE